MDVQPMDHFEFTDSGKIKVVKTQVLEQTPELCLAAVMQNGLPLQFVDSQLFLRN